MFNRSLLEEGTSRPDSWEGRPLLFLQLAVR